ncbi:MAG: hypothetical protein R6V18_01620, partial [Desulfuromonadaceae bacterium]
MNSIIIHPKVKGFHVCKVLSVLILFLGLWNTHAGAQDARTGVQTPEALLERTAAHKEKVAAQVEKLRRELERDRKAIEEKLAQQRDEVKELERTHAGLLEKVETRRTELEAQKELEQKHNQQHAELLGSIRSSSADVVGMVKNSPVTALMPQHDQKLEEFLATDAAPGIREVRALREVMLGQIRGAAQVQRKRITIVDRAGKQMEAEVVLLGAFTALYQSDAEVGFALYSP